MSYYQNSSTNIKIQNAGGGYIMQNYAQGYIQVIMSK